MPPDASSKPLSVSISELTLIYFSGLFLQVPAKSLNGILLELTLIHISILKNNLALPMLHHILHLPEVHVFKGWVALGQSSVSWNFAFIEQSREDLLCVAYLSLPVVLIIFEPPLIVALAIWKRHPSLQPLIIKPFSFEVRAISPSHCSLSVSLVMSKLTFVYCKYWLTNGLFLFLKLTAWQHSFLVVLCLKVNQLSMP